LSAAEVRYCRSVTQVWSAFFVLNGSMAGVLALAAPLACGRCTRGSSRTC